MYLELLLNHNAFVNVRNKTGMTPLHLAAKNGKILLNFVWLLLNTVLHNSICLSKGYNTMVRRLVTEYGALIDAMTLVNNLFDLW